MNADPTDPVLMSVITAMEGLLAEQGPALALYRYEHYPRFKELADRAVAQIKGMQVPAAPVIELEILLARCRCCGLVLMRDGSRSFSHPREEQSYQLPGPVYLYPVKGK